MPVRIYDIAKKLGIENKEVLAKAKELGITNARVASSTLDKITAEYLEQHLQPKPQPPAELPPAPAPEPAVAPPAPLAVEQEAQIVSEPVSAAPAKEKPVECPQPHEEHPKPEVSAQPAKPPTPHPEPVTASQHPVAEVIPQPQVESKPIEATPVAEVTAPAVVAPVTHQDKVVPEIAEAAKGEIQAEAKKTETAEAVSVAPAAPVVVEPPPAPSVPVAAEAPPVVETQRPTAPAITTPSVPPPAPVVEAPPAPVAAVPVAPPPPTPPPPPPAPAKPGIGDKVGFIQLPTKFTGRSFDRKESPKQAPKAAVKHVQAQQNKQGPSPKQDGQRPHGGSPHGQPQKGPQQQGRSPGHSGHSQQQGKGQPGAGGGGGRPGQQSRGAVVMAPPPGAVMISMKPPIIVRDLADKLNRKPFQIIADLMEAGVFATVNQAIDEAVATRICAKHGFRFELEKRDRSKQIHAPIKRVVDFDPDDKPEDLKPRAPVVTIMGHVDHGKTTLLDGIRKSNVAAGEAGGITQHIGAYTISFPHPEDKKRIQQITFLDTPGHAAFSAMRARGATVTDIVILVVAANDGVMPQTLEALSHAQAAKVPILVAINKCDHPSANPLKVKQQLRDKGLVADDWGGDTIFVECSGLTRQGVDKLLEMLLLQADMLELKANHTRKAKGNVIESGLEPGGPTATVLVRKGTLHVGDVIICGPFYGKVRALINEDGKRLKEAGPSHAVKVLGMNGVPEAGLEFAVVDDEKLAREEAEKRASELRLRSQEIRQAVTLENLFATLDNANAKVLKTVVKADTQGSVEAIVEALKKIESSKVTLEIIHSAVGTITESDVLLASASKAIILGFHTRVDSEATDVAKREGVQIKLYAIIYELIDEVKDAMAGLLEPIIKETIVGSAEVRKIFALSKGGNVAGCMVSQGRILRGKVRVVRRRGVIYEGVISSLRRYQDEVNEVRAGMECGIRIDGFNEFQEGDAIECYSVEKISQKLT